MAENETPDAPPPIELPPPMSGTEQLPPPLIVGPDRLTFSVGRQSAQVQLGPLLAQGEKQMVPLLLYGLVLSLHDIGESLRAALALSEREIQRGREMQAGGAVDVVIQQLEKLGIPLPDLRTALGGVQVKHSTPRGDGAGAGSAG